MMKRALQIFCLLLLIVLFQACHVGRFFYWNFADINDHKKFPSVSIPTSPHPFYFYPAQKPLQPILPALFHYAGETTDFDHFLKKHKTLAFLVIRNDTLIYERYFNGQQQNTPLPAFSISKSVVSALVGIAIDQGSIESVHQPLSDFLPELTDSAFRHITLEHLLNMRSGIRFKESYYNPFGDMARYYYGRNLKKYLTRLKVEMEPDRIYNYQSVNTLLLAQVLEIACDRPIETLLSETIWQKCGMRYPSSWSIDSRQHHTVKAFCCLNVSPIDLAKFGRLYLEQGLWNGQQVIPKEWVRQSTREMNFSRDIHGYGYTYQWRIQQNGAYFAKGLLGQYIWILPQKNIVIVRMGKKSGGINWAAFATALSQKL